MLCDYGDIVAVDKSLKVERMSLAGIVLTTDEVKTLTEKYTDGTPSYEAVVDIALNALADKIANLSRQESIFSVSNMITTEILQPDAHSLVAAI